MAKRSVFLVLLLSASLFILNSCSSMLGDLKKLDRTDRLDVYLENVDNDNYTLLSNQSFNYEAPEGFVLARTSYHEEFDAEGKSVIVKKNYYNRKIITIYYNFDGGQYGYTDEDSNNEISSFTSTGKYGALIDNVLDGTNLSKLGYVFKGWDPYIPLTYPSEDLTVTALWEEHLINYSVEYYMEDTKGEYKQVKKDIFAAPDNTEIYVDQYVLESEAVVGFKAPVYKNLYNGSPVTQITVSEDTPAQNTIFVFYERQLYTYTFILDVPEDSGTATWQDGSTENKTITKKFGLSIEEELKAVSHPIHSDENYNIESNKWKDKAGTVDVNIVSVPTVMTAENRTFYTKFISPFAKYKVEHYKQNKDLETYTLDDTENLTGEIGNLTVAVEKVYEGFILRDEIVQKEVLEDNSVVIKLYYNRVKVSVKVNPNGGKWVDGRYAGTSAEIEVTGYYELPIAYPFAKEPVLEHFEFASWDRSVISSTKTALAENFPAQNKTYVVKWTQIEAYYTVKHLLQKVSDDKSSVLSEYEVDEAVQESEKTYGKLGEYTNAHVKEIPGFELNGDFAQEKILADNSVVIEIKYDRKAVTNTFDPNGGRWGIEQTSSHASKTSTGKYGTLINFTDQPVRDYYEFVGWDKKITGGELPEVYSVVNETYVAKWKYVGAKYRVVYKFEDLSGNYVEDHTRLEPKNVPDNDEIVYSGTVTNEVAPIVNGFTPENFVQLEISPDGSTELVINYERNLIPVVFDANGGEFTNGEIHHLIYVKYEGSVTEAQLAGVGTPEYPTDVSKQFANWEEYPASITENTTVKALWSNIETSIINGVGTYTNEDISLNVLITSTQLKVTVTGAVSTLNFEVIILDGKEVNISAGNIVRDGKTITFTLNGSFDVSKSLPVCVEVSDSANENSAYTAYVSVEPKK